MACSCGSTNRGQRLHALTIVPFSIETASLGSPALRYSSRDEYHIRHFLSRMYPIQVAMSVGGVKSDTGDRSSRSANGFLPCKINGRQCVLRSKSRYGFVKGPAYVTKAAAKSTSPTIVSASACKICTLAAHRVFSLPSAAVKRRARFIFIFPFSTVAIARLTSAFVRSYSSVSLARRSESCRT